MVLDCAASSTGIILMSGKRRPDAVSQRKCTTGLHEFPNVKRWLEEVGERPALKKAMAMGPEFREDSASISAEEQARRRKLVAEQRAQRFPRNESALRRGICWIAGSR